MQDVTPNAQTYQGSGGNIGGTTGPNDGEDEVESSTVLISMGDSANTFAYLAALAMGSENAPPTTQPGILSGGYGIQRIAQVASLSALTAIHLNASGNYVEVGGYGLYFWIPNRSLPTDIQTGFSDGLYVVYDDGLGSDPGSFISDRIFTLGQGGFGVQRIQRVPDLGTLANTLNPSAGDISLVYDTTSQNGIYLGIWAFNPYGTGYPVTAATNTYVIDSAQTVSAWTIDTVYFSGQFRTNDGGKKYLCTTGGLGAHSGGPTGTGSAIADNDAIWKYVTVPGQWINDLASARGLNLLTHGPAYGIAAVDANGLVPITELPFGQTAIYGSVQVLATDGTFGTVTPGSKSVVWTAAAGSTWGVTPKTTLAVSFTSPRIVTADDITARAYVLNPISTNTADLTVQVISQVVTGSTACVVTFGFGITSDGTLLSTGQVGTIYGNPATLIVSITV